MYWFDFFDFFITEKKQTNIYIHTYKYIYTVHTRLGQMNLLKDLTL